MTSAIKSALPRILFASLFALSVAPAFAAKDVRDGKVVVYPVKDDHFKVNEYSSMPKAQLYGYIGDLRDSQGLKTIVLKRSERATPEQLNSISSIARHLEINAVDDDGNNLIKPMAEPAAEPAPAAQEAQPMAEPAKPAEPATEAEPVN
ncbi:MAG: hypothetical protein WBP11_15555 [Dokdonella sp.]